MGFFQKLKKGLSHGGVKVQVKAPATVRSTDAYVPVTVTVIATDSPANIKLVEASILCETSQNHISGANSQSGPTTSTQIVSLERNVKPFSLNPGESKVLEFKLAMNLISAIGQQLDPNGAGAKIAKTVSTIQALSQTVSPTQNVYSIKASADIDGIVMNATDIQMLQVLRPGEIGKSLNFKL